VRRLDAAARDFHRIVDRVVRAPAWILEIQVLADRAEFVLAIRNARAIGLDALARSGRARRRSAMAAGRGYMSFQMRTVASTAA